MAQSISESNALQTASQVLNVPLQELEIKHGVNQENIKYHVIQAPADEGFCIIGGKDNNPHIIGYSHEGSIDIDNLPPPLAEILDQYDPNSFRNAQHEMPCVSRTDNEVVLETAKWGQGYPYNMLCPTIESQLCPTGCVATAMAIVMRYHQWPTRGYGENSYEWRGQTISQDFSATEFNWDNMPLEEPEGGYSEEQAQAIATLMKTCGVAVKMDYDLYGSAAGISDEILYKYFNFAESGNLNKGDFPELWYTIIRDNIDKGNPVIMDGMINEDSEGHEFVCDGYSGDEYYHINWGWEGSSNGFFNLEDLYNLRAMVYDIYPVEERKEYANVKLNYTYLGFQTDTENIEPEITFNAYYRVFSTNGEHGIALVDSKGNIKEILDYVDYNTSSFNDLKVTTEVKDDDIIQAIGRDDTNSPWLPIRSRGICNSFVPAKNNEIKKADIYLNYDPQEIIVEQLCEPIYNIDYEVKITASSNKPIISVTPLREGVTLHVTDIDEHSCIASWNIRNLSYEVSIASLGDDDMIEDAVYLVEEPGTLSSLVQNNDNLKIKRIKLIGTITAEDFYYMKNHMPLLEAVDITEATIKKSSSGSYVTYDDVLPIIAFSGLSTLRELYLPQNLKGIGIKALMGTNIEKIDLPQGLESIEENGLSTIPITELTLPSSITFLDDYFVQGKTIKNLYVNWLDPSVVKFGEFDPIPKDNFDFENCILHVPTNKKELYQSIELWSRFIHIEDDMPNGIVDFEPDSNLRSFHIYNLQGIIVKENASSLSDLPSGYYIINGKLVHI